VKLRAENESLERSVADLVAAAQTQEAVWAAKVDDLQLELATTAAELRYVACMRVCPHHQPLFTRSLSSSYVPSLVPLCFLPLVCSS